MPDTSQKQQQQQQTKQKPQANIHEEVAAALKRLEAKDPGLKPFLKKAYGYAVFPSVGKAGVVVGGGYGRGLVFERGKPVGYATIAKLTLGVDVGGDTFTEVIAFESREVFERFKRGRFGFSANASAVLVKAGAAGTADYEKGAAAFVYSRGGMLLELSLGGQKLKFKPMSGAGAGEGREEEEGQGGEGEGGGEEQGEEGQEEGGAEDQYDDEGGEEEQQDDEGGEAGEEEDGDEGGGSGMMQRITGAGSGAGGALGNALGRVRDAASSAATMIKQHPVASTLIGGGLAAGIVYLLTGRGAGSAQGQQSDDEEDDQQEGEAEDVADDEQDEGQSVDDEDEQSEGDEEDWDQEQDEADEGAGEEDEGDEGEAEEEEEEAEPAPRRSSSHGGGGRMRH